MTVLSERRVEPFSLDGKNCLRVYTPSRQHKGEYDQPNFRLPLRSIALQRFFSAVFPTVLDRCDGQSRNRANGLDRSERIEWE
jgi:hypothetical protein